MAFNILRRLERLKEVANRQEEVSAEDAMILWLEFVRRLFPTEGRDPIAIPDYFKPPFWDVNFEDYKKAKKVVEDYDRQTEQTTRDLFS